jgi:hypothetical protein
MSDGGGDETLAYLRERVAEEFQVPSQLAHRLRGEGLGALRADAARMRSELGMPSLDGEPDRDSAGRFTPSSGGAVDFNRVIREASGRR